jgi:leader peptidase (prepilin peptidase)/N-methyltransferase
MNPYLVLWALIAGSVMGPWIAWAIRSWPGHEALEDEYLECWSCEGGKHRGCCNAGSEQDRWYTFLSMLVAGVAVGLYGFGTKAALAYLFSMSALIITVVDIRFYIIPDTLSITGCWLGLLYALVCHGVWRLGWSLPQHYVPLYDSFVGFMVGGGFLWALGWIAYIVFKKEGMGGGDVKLLAAMGAWMGWQVVLAVVIIASLLGSIGGIGSILYRRIRYNQKYQPLSHMIPFGPYLVVAFLFVFYAGMEPLYYAMDLYQDWITRRMIGP